MGEIVGANNLRYYDLSNIYGHGVPQWPSAPNLNIRVYRFHASDGIFVQQIESIMHRSTHMDARLHVTENGGSLTSYEPWPSAWPSICFLRLQTSARDR
jgi:kynurenine formamidase